MKKTMLFTVLLCTFFACTEITRNVPEVIEISDVDSTFSTGKLDKFCQENQIDMSSVYYWKNHWVIFNQDIKASDILVKLKAEYPTLSLKLYDKPFYNFNRQEMTGESPAKKWKHVIMTANLVADTTMQKEYMEYHRTQIEKWPEISKGFINADFQQLLVYRSGRQLMLVISIPEGKTLDELNPKTTENNPRVDEWNKIMAKYQVKIDDAPENIVWVFLKQVKK